MNIRTVHVLSPFERMTVFHGTAPSLLARLIVEWIDPPLVGQVGLAGQRPRRNRFLIIGERIALVGAWVISSFSVGRW